MTRQWPILGAVPSRASLLVLIALAVLAATVEVAVARHFLLDDALIHVRNADLALHAGLPTSFADSSPLFLLVTAAGLALGGSFYVTKIVSVAAFGILVALLVAAAWRERHPPAQAVIVALLVLALSPFGVKWLTDGMETSLAVLLALLLARTLDSKRFQSAGVGVIALLCILLRPELVALVAATAVGQIVRSNRRLALATALGGLAAFAVLYGVFGHLWSDAAVAKERYGYSPAEFLELLASVAAGAGLLGVGLALAWLGLMAVTIRAWRNDPALLLGELSFPLVLVAIALRGEAVEGIRPLLPFLAFSLACGVALVRRCLPARPARGRMLLPPLAVLGAVAVGVWAVDAVAFNRIVSVQARSMEAMRTRDWSALSGHTGVAWDVGYLAYFTKAPVCDAQGLIDGRAFASLSLPERLRQCAKVADFAFVDPARFRILTTALDMSGWRVCDRFDFAHRRGPVNVYLIVAPQLAQAPFCPDSAPRIDSVDQLRQASR